MSSSRSATFTAGTIRSRRERHTATRLYALSGGVGSGRTISRLRRTSSPESEIGMIVARRVYLYAIAFAAIWVLINGIAGLLEVALEAIVEAALGPFLSVGSDNLTDRVSFYGALTGIGLVVWAIHWGLAARAVARDPRSERGSAIRKLYLYGFLLVGGLVLTFQ